MLGDDVASSMTQISTQVVGKATEVFLEFLKIMLERDRQRKDGEKSVELSGGKNTYTRLKKGGVEAFQVYCSNHDIPVNFLENKVSVNVIDDNGTPKITVSDSKINRKIALTFTSKANFEKVLREHLGYSDVMAVQTSNALMSKLSKGQLNYYLNSSRQLEQMDFYEKNIKFISTHICTVVHMTHTQDKLKAYLW
jgi:hypothetical protein